MDCSPPGSSVHGISQARIPEWVASAFSRGSSQHRNRTHVSCNAGRFFTAELPGKPFYPYRHYSNLFWWFFIISCPLEPTVSLWLGHGLLSFPNHSPLWWSHPLWWLLMLFRSWTFISPHQHLFPQHKLSSKLINPTAYWHFHLDVKSTSQIEHDPHWMNITTVQS